MKKCLGLFLASVITLGMYSCSEDFDVAAPYKDITVVYGMLEYGQTNHYIRVQKAFLDQNRSALELAKNVDSNFYRNIEVRMKTIVGNQVLNDVVLPKVDMNLEDLVKEPGTFFTAPNYGYKYTNNLNPNATYRLLIINKETGNIDSADTKVIDTSAATFNINELNKVTRPVYSIEFSANNPRTPFTLNFNPTPVNGAYVEGYLKFHYVNVLNTVQQDTFFVWKFQSKAVNGGVNDKIEVSTDQILNSFSTFIPKSNGEDRYIDSVDVFIWAADQNYYNYIVNNQVQGGLTADQIRPNFTTIRGKNVLGVFGSRAKKIRTNVGIGNASVDSLIKNKFTKDLNFKGRSDH